MQKAYSGLGREGGVGGGSMPKIHATRRTVHFPTRGENNTYTVHLGFVMAVQLQALKYTKSAEGEDSYIIQERFRTGTRLTFHF